MIVQHSDTAATQCGTCHVHQDILDSLESTSEKWQKDLLAGRTQRIIWKLKINETIERIYCPLFWCFCGRHVRKLLSAM